MLAVGILLLVGAFLVIILIAWLDSDRIETFSKMWWGFATGVLLALGVYSLTEYKCPTPTAIDVYQGHTTLEYKVVDGQVIDSTVVFTKEYLDSLK